MQRRAARLTAVGVLLMVSASSLAACDVSRVGARCRGGFARDSTHLLVCTSGRWQHGPTLADTARALIAVQQPKAVPIASLSSLVIAPETPGGYDRDLFQPSGWGDTDGDGCDTRAEVLQRQSTAPVSYSSGCYVRSGQWTSIYDGAATTAASDLEIDHVVALAEAWRSGASRWDDARRHAFSDDMDNLVAVSISSNRSKNDHDPAHWLPPDHASWCWFGNTWVSVKVKWGLTADQQEHDALASMTAGC